MRYRASLVAAFGLILGIAGAARAQGVVPGGWGPGIGYQSVGVVGANSYSGRGYSGYGSGGAYSPYGPYVPVRPNSAWNPAYAPPARTVNGLIPLGNIIRRSTRRSR